ncbi:MAG: hypothetical protein ABL949_17230 [Fimbriimonadaceae bacterium]
MNAAENVFKGDAAAIAAVDAEAPLVDAKRNECDDYVTVYAGAAKIAEKSSDFAKPAVYRFLAVITGFCPKFDTPNEPYGPWLKTAAGRSPVPTDLTEDDITALSQLAPLVRDPALRARLFDLLWELAKAHHACAEAASAYLANAERLDAPEVWLYVAKAYQRALHTFAKNTCEHFGATRSIWFQVVHARWSDGTALGRDFQKSPLDQIRLDIAGHFRWFQSQRIGNGLKAASFVFQSFQITSVPSR